MNPFKLVWSSVSGALGGIYGYLAVAAFCLVLGAGGTYKIMHNANLAAQTKTAEKTVQLVVHQGAIQTKLVEVYVPRFIFIGQNTARIQQEIPQRVTPEIDRAFPVPLGFVRVFNDASHGPVPGPAAGGDADPSGVPLSDVAHAHAADEGTLDVCRAQNDEWWTWYDQHRAAWGKVSK
jgi:hypothetical protein